MKFFSIIFFLVFIIVASPISFRNHDKTCAMPFTYKPVCGSDGMTYSNYWALQCELEKFPGTLLFCKGLIVLYLDILVEFKMRM
ncbi:hypothetical protein Avbf_17183 [Armadillidium vulgare]|nr:hypothetical protein Avbf_17183 [Armadillidium vulgare]